MPADQLLSSPEVIWQATTEAVLSGQAGAVLSGAWRLMLLGDGSPTREVDGLARVHAPWLEERFGEPGPFWSRHYRFFRGGKELTVIREVFSPALERWLGPASTGPGEALSQTAPQRHNSLQTQ